ncbi:MULTISPECIES: 3-deoxy-7-phosphoheptulonate synthase [Streptomyces]|uniref:Phospho-2-dehydro-3-deoxyheptonate aldolase n=1 Tax=Streptomyces lasalocidi TaxID=324833 RepID=A0A4U5WDP7_STRLS|nr:3-deoxy-7-phosphoheptulonate synthase [Streptomyces lasalocidi]TKS99361.1 3-deoxy-7-phosphoheptulonate synthase [Streptomyces lasalocidi]
MAVSTESLAALPALQQPDWDDPEAIERVRRRLRSAPPLVTYEDVTDLRAHLAEAAAGTLQIVQAGDCAEDWDECTPEDVARKAGLLDVLAGTMAMTAHRPVLRVGRLAGQFAKPRSRPTETVGGVELPVYRGHMVNSPEPDTELRRPDPSRLLTGYLAAGTVMELLGWPARRGRPRSGAPVWTSHEALLLDYELPLVRRQPDGRSLLTSTHWPWIGERTRQLDGAHVALLASVANPVACKVGPGMTPDELLALCERLDPGREPGRLTLIARMGADVVGDRLPPLVGAVRAAGHPVVWLSDPMHGNTVTGPGGLKTRLVRTVVQEVEGFHTAVSGAGGVTGGLHLETTPDEVTECVAGRDDLQDTATKYTSLCDPRLNPRQAITVASAWRG